MRTVGFALIFIANSTTFRRVREGAGFPESTFTVDPGPGTAPAAGEYLVIAAYVAALTGVQRREAVVMFRPPSLLEK